MNSSFAGGFIHFAGESNGDDILAVDSLAFQTAGQKLDRSYPASLDCSDMISFVIDNFKATGGVRTQKRKLILLLAYSLEQVLDLIEVQGQGGLESYHRLILAISLGNIRNFSRSGGVDELVEAGFGLQGALIAEGIYIVTKRIVALGIDY